jgi:hypothetical protein
MFSQLKSTPLQFRQWLLACDSEHLKSDLLAQLDKSLPNPDELKKLSELKNEINDLPDAEQYFCAVSSTLRSKNKQNFFYINRLAISNVYINVLKYFYLKANTKNYLKMQKK